MKINRVTMRMVMMVCLMAVIVSAAQWNIEAKSEASDDIAYQVEIINPADHDCNFVKPSSMEAKSQEIEGKNDRRSPRRGLFSCLLPKADDKKKEVEHVMVGYHGTCADRGILLKWGYKFNWIVRPKYPQLGHNRLHTTDNLSNASAFAFERCNERQLTYVCYILMDASELRNQRKTYIPRWFRYPELGIQKYLQAYDRNTREYEERLFKKSNLDSQNSETTESTEPIRFGNTTHKIDGTTFSSLQVSWPKHMLKHMKAFCQNYGFYESDEVVKYEDLLAKSADPNAEVDPLWGRILGAENFYNKELH